VAIARSRSASREVIAAGEPLRLFNTLGRQLQPFEPLEAGTARIYSCGPTVYAYQHIGNLRAYVFADTLRRVLEWKGYAVLHVINITDVGHLTSDLDVGEDKVELASRREHRSVWEIAAHYTDAFMRDLVELRARTPSTWARATEHVAQMIEFARTLEDKGYAYRLETGLYFDTGTVGDYGKLARLDLDGLREGARVAPTPGKRHPADFALWRSSPKRSRRLMEWDSPWGKGAPGWHLECSTMSIEYLGERFDLHTGGVDHIPVHHTNEIVQSEAYLGRPWVPFWLHNEFISLDRAKIAKSTGNALRLSDLEQRGYHPLSYRYMLLASHYRSQIEFTWDGLDAARVGHRRLLERIRERVPCGGQPLAHDAAAARLGRRGHEYLARIDAGVSNDLNTPKALAVVTELSRDTSLAADELAVLVSAAEDLLSLGLLDLCPDDLEARPTNAASPPENVERLIEQRAEARRRGDFAGADRIRDRLERMGIELRDSRDGTTWKVRAATRSRTSDEH
jgi:cysteinyl-tRNA synthetase